MELQTIASKKRADKKTNARKRQHVQQSAGNPRKRHKSTSNPHIAPVASSSRTTLDSTGQKQKRVPHSSDNDSHSHKTRPSKSRRLLLELAKGHHVGSKGKQRQDEPNSGWDNERGTGSSQDEDSTWG